MPDAQVSFAGNLTDNPELRHTEGGIARATLRGPLSRLTGLGWPGSTPLTAADQIR